MTAHYTVVQYLPDPTADERVNVGVIVWDGERVVSRFLSNWRRVRAFGGEDVGFLREFARSVSTMTSDQLGLPRISGRLDEKQLRKMIGEWSYSIRFTEPRGSLKPVDQLIRDVVPVFLRESPPRARRARSRRIAASIATRSLFAAVEEWTPDHAEQLVRTNQKLQGQVEKHRFDVVLANGKAMAALDAISFEVADEDRLETEIDALAWSLIDVRNENEDIPLAVFALLPPKAGSSSLYRKASHVCKELNADLLTEKMIDDWARARAREVAHVG